MSAVTPRTVSIPRAELDAYSIAVTLPWESRAVSSERALRAANPLPAATESDHSLRSLPRKRQSLLGEVTAIRNFRAALSLLEVILALTILSIAMALLGELVSIGARSGASARELTRAQLYCESKMAEYSAGLSVPVSTSATEYETDAEWEYSVDVQTMGSGGLIAVTVTMQESSENDPQPVSYSMTRWMPDPNVEWPTEFFEDPEEEAGA